MLDLISTHTPLAGRDGLTYLLYRCLVWISTHTPLAGRDLFAKAVFREYYISTHTPLAGRDENVTPPCHPVRYFYSHAPRGT